MLKSLALASALLCLSSIARAETCIASWYGAESGRQTASGERFRPEGISCAHKHLAFGTVARVTDLATGRSIACRINDRGPFVRGRCIDLSHGAARALGMGGLARVRIE